MPVLQEAIDHYHNLLSSREYLQSTAEALDKSASVLSVSGRRVCTVLRPCFVTARTYSAVQDAATKISKAIQILAQELFVNAELLKQLELSPEEEEIIKIDCGYGFPDASARLDAFLDSENRLRFVEYNADSPGGIGYGDTLSEVFESMPVMRKFGERFAFRRLPVRRFVLDSLMGAYQRWGGKGAPNIAIVDWSNAVTLNEFVIFREFFRAHGCGAEIAAPEDLEIRNGSLYARDFRVDLIYKRLLVGEMLQAFGTHHSLIEAARERLVCIANGFGVQMVFKKILFAMLSDPDHSNLFDVETNAVIRETIPWTRKVQEGFTSYKEHRIDLLPFVRKNKDILVLKPNSEYGGKGVMLGWETSEAEWDDAMKRALAEPSIVQERVELGRELYPALIDGELRFDERYFDLDPYVWDGLRVEGCGVRLSKLSLMNVSAGGGSAVPMFILQ